MKKLSAVSVLVVFAVFVQVFAQTATLHTYVLTASEKTQLSFTDGKAAAFWTTDWTGRDSIEMTPTAAYSVVGHPAWTGADDANLTVKAAADGSGLYMNFTIEDNVFIAPAGTDWTKDDCDVYFDAMSASQIASMPAEDFVNQAYGWWLSTTSQEYQMFMGAGTAVGTYFSFSYYDPVFFSWDMSVETNYSDMDATYPGWAIEVYDIDATHKGIEMKIPWGYMGTNGIADGTPLAGAHFAFAGGYDDEDDASATQCKNLRWCGNADPYGSVGSWGDLVMDAGMPSVGGIILGPSAPTLLSPANAATGVVTNPALKWQKSTGAISYRLQVSTVSDCSSPFKDSSTIIDTSISLSGLLTNTRYYWRANVTTTSGTSTWSSIYTFTTVNNAPVFATQPVSQTVNLGQSVTFTSLATGTPAPTYQWYRNGVVISGATAASYTISSVAFADTGSYSDSAFNSAGKAVSNSAKLTVYYAPVFSIQPQSQTIIIGHPVTFTSSASGNPAPIYQWYKNGTPITGAKSTSYTISSTVIGDSGSYLVIATNNVSSTLSNIAVLKVTTPQLISATASLNGSGAQQVLLTFNLAVDTFTVNALNIDSLFPINNHHGWLCGFGSIGGASWNPQSTMLLVTLASTISAPTVTPGDTIAFVLNGSRTVLTGGFTSVINKTRINCLPLKKLDNVKLYDVRGRAVQRVSLNSQDGVIIAVEGTAHKGTMVLEFAK